GKNAGDLARAQINHAGLVRLMVGRELQQFFQKHPAVIPPGTTPRLTVREVCYEGGPTTPVSFELYPGEIVGMAGLVGAGRTELAEAIFGVRRITRGEVLLDGQRLKVRHPRQAIAAGIVLAPEDRRYHGLLLEDSVQHNISLP